MYRRTNSIFITYFNILTMQKGPLFYHTFSNFVTRPTSTHSET